MNCFVDTFGMLYRMQMKGNVSLALHFLVMTILITMHLNNSERDLYCWHDHITILFEIVRHLRYSSMERKCLSDPNDF